MPDFVPVQDKQSVTEDWQSVEPLIDGVVIKRLPPVEDDRGEICEIYRPSWNVHSAPLVFVYQVCIRPGKVKGWVVHRRQDDRIFVSRGTLQFALFDDRDKSSTRGLLNKFTFSDRSRVLIVIPHGIYHGVKNLGTAEAVFVNMPTEPYCYENPDKYRLPLRNDLIPFAFEEEPGW